MASRPKICVVGSLNMDLVTRTPRFPLPGETIMGGPFATYPGGKGANQAVAAARLGAEVSFVGCVGEDAYGAEFRRVLHGEGIDIAHLQTKAGIATGVGVIAIDERGQNSIIVALGANLALTPADIDAAMPTIREADVVMLQLEIPIESNAHVLARSDDIRGLIMLNAAPAQRIFGDLFRLVDVLVVNEVEARAQITPADDRLTDEALITAIPLGSDMLTVLTIAERGCVTCQDGDIRIHPAFTVEAIDTVGAGDSFCGALGVAMAEGADAGDDLDRAIRFASAAAAISVTRHGAIPSLPTHSEVQRFLRDHA